MGNPLFVRGRSLCELMTELRVRCGYVHQGTAASNNDALMRSFLQEAHDYLYGELQPPVARKVTVIVLEPGSWLYDWHNDTEDEDISPGMVKAVRLLDAAGEYLVDLPQWVDGKALADSEPGQPQRYDTLGGQMVVTPVPDAVYGVQVEYLAGKPRFTQDTDRPGVPDRLVLQYALATAKAHFRMPDAQSVAATFQNMLAAEKMAQHENRRYFHQAILGDGEQTVMRTASGQYTFRG